MCARVRPCVCVCAGGRARITLPRLHASLTAQRAPSRQTCAMFVRLLLSLRFYTECLSPYQSEVSLALGRLNRVEFDQVRPPRGHMAIARARTHPHT